MLTRWCGKAATTWTRSNERGARKPTDDAAGIRRGASARLFAHPRLRARPPAQPPARVPAQARPPLPSPPPPLPPPSWPDTARLRPPRQPPPPPTPLGHPPRRKSRVYNAHRPPPLARHHRQRGRPRRRRLTDRHSVLCPRKGREARGGEGPLGPPLAGHTSAPRRAPPPPALRAATSPCARPRRRHDGWVGTDTASG